MINSIAEQFDKMVPSSQDAEMAALASAIIDAGAAGEVFAIVGPEDFFDEENKKLCRIVKTMRREQRSCDAVTVYDELIKVMPEPAAKDFLGRVLLSVPSHCQASEYAKIVLEMSKLRGMIRVANEILRGAYARADANKIIGWASTAISRISSSGNDGTHIMRDIIRTVLDELSSPDHGPLLQTGFARLDEALGGGIAPGELFILGARPSMGKSVLAKQIALRVAKRAVPVMFYSMEEGSGKIGRNLLADGSNVENRTLRLGNITADEIRRVGESANALQGLPIIVNDRLANADQIHSHLSAMIAKHGVKLVILDYLQLLDAGGRTDFEQATFASKAVAKMIRDLKIPGLVTAQLNRQVEHRDSTKPRMTDLRSTGQIEQDADFIGLLHREDYYHIKEPGYQMDHTAEIAIVKARDGERGQVVYLGCEMRYQRFTDIQTPATAGDGVL